MKSYIPLVVSLASLVAAEPIISRQASRGDEFRARFCVKSGLSECDRAVDQCRKNKKPVWACVRQGHKPCVVVDPSACAQAVDSCLDGDTSDDEVRGCVVQELSLGGEDGQTGSEALDVCGKTAMVFEKASEAYTQTWDAYRCEQIYRDNAASGGEDGNNAVSDAQDDGQ